MTQILKQDSQPTGTNKPRTSWTHSRIGNQLQYYNCAYEAYVESVNTFKKLERSWRTASI